MNDQKIKHLVLSALFAALICVATFVIRIPTPGTSGYIHPGDALVILSGIFLGPAAGFLAAGIGSALSDLLGGYMIYVPITFAVKGAVALCAALIYRKVGICANKKTLAVIMGGVIDIIFVVFGYGIPEAFIYGIGGALASALPNAVQGLSGLVLSLILYPLLAKFFHEPSVKAKP